MTDQRQSADAGAVAGVRPEPRLLTLINELEWLRDAAIQSFISLQFEFGGNSDDEIARVNSVIEQVSAALRAEGIARPLEEKEEKKNDHTRVDNL